VVLAGPLHHFVETREQPLARKLAAMGYDVIFLPCPDESPRESSFAGVVAPLDASRQFRACR
jgi:hypothetical protein